MIKDISIGLIKRIGGCYRIYGAKTLRFNTYYLFSI